MLTSGELLGDELADEVATDDADDAEDRSVEEDEESEDRLGMRREESQRCMMGTGSPGRVFCPLSRAEGRAGSGGAPVRRKLVVEKRFEMRGDDVVDGV